MRIYDLKQTHIFNIFPYRKKTSQEEKYVFSHFLSCGMHDSINWVQFMGSNFNFVNIRDGTCNVA